MTAYFQMGHHSENLIGETDLGNYRGIVLSPINRLPSELSGDVSRFCSLDDYDIVFDPQLYYPNSERGKLHDHPYFPSDFDTVDLSSLPWWDRLVGELAEHAASLCVTALASPVFQPRVWSSDYYRLCTDISRQLTKAFKGEPLRVYSTVMTNMSELADEGRVMEIAAIMSDTDADGYYLVFQSDTQPRRELSDEAELYGMMSLISELKQTERPVLVSNCSSDMVLFKAAGADHCATGKFFNLRRFTKSRYEEPKEGGGQLPYWFEHSLFAFLREADLLRLRDRGFEKFVGVGNSTNHWGNEIINQFSEAPGNPWLRLAWRQYLAWFGETESEVSAEDSLNTVLGWLNDADANWGELENDSLLFDERLNNGNWIRRWHQALIRFRRRVNATT